MYNLCNTTGCLCEKGMLNKGIYQTPGQMPVDQIQGIKEILYTNIKCKNARKYFADVIRKMIKKTMGPEFEKWFFGRHNELKN